jgi:hypothetical protein
LQFGFVRIGNTCFSTTARYFKASNSEANDGFGNSISLSADGNTLVIGSSGEASAGSGINGNQTDNSKPISGAAYVFINSGNIWVQQAYLKASNPDANDHFGISVSLSADGNTLAIGAPLERSSATGINGNQTDNTRTNSGAVYIFSRTANTWSQQAYVKASNTGSDDHFGVSISLSADGNTLGVGATGESSSSTGINGNQGDKSAVASGAVYVYSRSGTNWSQQAYLKASNTGADDWFGISVYLSADGNTLAVGALYEDSSATDVNGNQVDNATSDSGAVYVFRRSGNSWSQEAYLKSSNPGADDYFGAALSLSSNGATLSIGALYEDSSSVGVNGNQSNNLAVNSGAVYVFTRSTNSWSQRAYLKASNAGSYDLFGSSVSLSADGTMLAVGAWLECSSAIGISGNQADDEAPGAGAAFVFSLIGNSWVQQSYIKASNTGADDQFGAAVSLSADGSTLAIGSQKEDSSATGINGNQADNSASSAGAVYVYSP